MRSLQWYKRGAAYQGAALGYELLPFQGVWGSHQKMLIL